MLWCFQNFDLKIFTVIIKTIARGKICIMFFIRKKFSKRASFRYFPSTGTSTLSYVLLIFGHGFQLWAMGWGESD